MPQKLLLVALLELSSITPIQMTPYTYIPSLLESSAYNVMIFVCQVCDILNFR